MANVDGDENYVRVQVLTNTGALDRDKQLALVAQLTELVATAAKNPELMKRTAAEWEKALIEAGVPAGRVLSVPEILRDEHLAGRNFVSEFDGAAGKQIVTRGGFLFSEGEASPHAPAPALSEHTEAWLGKIGYDSETIQSLRKRRVI